MKLSSQEEYGLRCLLQVAMHESTTVQNIAAAEQISPEYTAKLMRVLRQGGLVVSTRGSAGGYRLARPPGEITLADAIVALDGPLFSEAFCQAHTGQVNTCVHTSTSCSIRAVWRFLGTALDGVLKKVTLADLVGGPIKVTHALHAEATP